MTKYEDAYDLLVNKKNEVVKETLIQAKDIIAQGWCRGDYKKGDRYCTTGALAVAAGCKFVPERLTPHLSYDIDEGKPGSMELWRQCIDILTQQLETVEDEDECCDFCYTPDLTDWNDDQPSKKPVLELLDKAIKSL